MEKLILFGILSLPLVYFSWRTLFSYKNHGFYRFFAWELILWLFVSNYKYWFTNPLSINQIFSWIFLLSSIYPAFAGFTELIVKGKPKQDNHRKSLFSFEKTTKLVNSGIYNYIRHPLYLSLILISWGIYLKNPTAIILLMSAVLSTILLYFTSRFDEKECIDYFGNEYIEYMKHSKMFIPYIL